MHLGELSPTEQSVLAALIGHLIRVDGQLSDDEIDAMSKVASEMGQEQWRTAFRAVHGKYRTTKDVLAFAESVVRNNARTKIQSVLADVAASDWLDAKEANFLGALANRWR